MTHGLRAYPSYKDSGRPWLGTIPSHWAMSRIKRFARVGNGSTPSRGKPEYWSATGVPWLNSGSVHQGTITRASRFVTNRALAECHLPQLQPGTVLVAITGQGKTRGTSGLLMIPATINQHMAYIAPVRQEVTGRFLRYSLVAAYLQLRAISDDAGGTKGALTCEDVRRFDVAVPPIDEQLTIAEFLDHHDHIVRRFIRNRRRLIEVLNEQKQAIINRAVTRGIDESAPLKPSGIDWLGDIPAHWHKKRLKYLANNINSQTTAKQPDEAYIALEHVESWTGRIRPPSGDVHFDSQVKRFRPGDVLFGKLRPYLAKVTRAECAGVCVGEFLVLRTGDTSILPEFLEAKLRSKQIIDLINSSTFGAKMPRADWRFIGNLVIAYAPTHAEQRNILTETEAATSILQVAIDRAASEIELVQEYRTRLIADVVTGKLDVRGFVPTEPMPADESADEPIEELGLEDEEADLVEEAVDAAD